MGKDMNNAHVYCTTNSISTDIFATTANDYIDENSIKKVLNLLKNEKFDMVNLICSIQ